MNKKLWEPRELVKAFVSFNSGVSLRHIATRLEKGMFSAAIKAKRPGERNKYNLQTAILYGIASYIETCGMGIEEAYDGAREIMRYAFDNIEGAAYLRGDLVLCTSELGEWVLFDLTQIKPIDEIMRNSKFHLYINVRMAVQAVKDGLGVSDEYFYEVC